MRALNIGEHFYMDKPIEEEISILVALWLHGIGHLSVDNLVRMYLDNRM